MKISRRRFLQSVGAGALAVGSIRGSLVASTDTTRIPMGLELYTVDTAMKSDFDGTLQKIAQIGYREIEFPWYYGRRASDVLKSLKTAALHCQSGLFSYEELSSDLSARIEFAQALNLKYMGCVMIPLPEAPDLRQALDKLSLDDFKRYAELFNKMGEQTRKAGIQLTYHNHDFEFKKFDGVVGYDELLRLTDPDLVQMEMDVGWVVWAGYDPVRYLREHPGRFSLLHLRDLKMDAPYIPLEMHSVEVGRGVIDWKRLLAVARASGVQIGYVEQDPGTVPASFESAKVSFDYVYGLRY